MERDSLIHGLILLSPICTSIEQHNFVEKEQEKQEKEKKIREVILSDDVRARMAIERTIKDCYDRTRSLEIYENKIFVGAPQNLTNQNGRYEFFVYQYECIEQWSHKWLLIMETIGKIRMAERFDIGSQFIEAHGQDSKAVLEWKKLCSEGYAKTGEIGKAYQKSQMPVTTFCKNVIKRYELEEKESDGNNLKKDSTNDSDSSQYKTKDSCKKACSDLVKSVLESPLKKLSETDFYFTLGRSFDELEEIREQVLAEQNARYYEMKMKDFGCGYIAEKSDLKLLREVREKLDSDRIVMINQWQ